MLKRPVYQLTTENVARLFEQVLNGEASEDDWDVFIEIPIRYNDDLEKVRQSSIDIYEQHLIGRSAGFLMAEQGLEAIAELRDELLTLND